MISAGQLRHQVRIERRSTVQDAAGEPELEWIYFAARRASVAASAGREVFASSAREGRVPTLFTLRYLEGVLPAMRLVWDERVFDILSAVDPDGLRTELLITAEEHVEESST